MPIFDVVLKRITVRGSIVGTRADLAEALAFAADGKVHAHIHRRSLIDVNAVFTALKAGTLMAASCSRWQVWTKAGTTYDMAPATV